ncbi:LPS assembly lipoprotein LptE [Flavobacteriales bacterium]|nr:LPS assembly lipoprotein LptE [Flavobacteriales bacterium]
MRHLITYIALLTLAFSSCGVYTFSGASISSDVKTVDIKFFENKTSLSPSNLSNNFTEALKDKLSSETNLSPVSSDGDLTYSGYISNYVIKPIAIQANETATKNRLTISVNVTFTNGVQEEYNFEKTFSRFADYDSNEDFKSVEEALNEEITEQLIDNIFNESFSNW